MNEDQIKKDSTLEFRNLWYVCTIMLQQCEKQSLSAFWRKTNETYWVHAIIQKNHRRLFPTSFSKITVADDSSQEWKKPVSHVCIVSKWRSQNSIFCDRAIGGADIETSPIYKVIKLYLCLFHLGEQKATSKFSHTEHWVCEMEKSKCRWQRTIVANERIDFFQISTEAPIKRWDKIRRTRASQMGVLWISRSFITRHQR